MKASRALLRCQSEAPVSACTAGIQAVPLTTHYSGIKTQGLDLLDRLDHWPLPVGSLLHPWDMHCHQSLEMHSPLQESSVHPSTRFMLDAASARETGCYFRDHHAGFPQGNQVDWDSHLDKPKLSDHAQWLNELASRDQQISSCERQHRVHPRSGVQVLARLQGHHLGP